MNTKREEIRRMAQEISGETWLEPIWDVVKGKARVARRDRKDVQENASEDLLVSEARKRGYGVLVIGHEYVVHADRVRVLIRPNSQ